MAAAITIVSVAIYRNDLVLQFIWECCMHHRHWTLEKRPDTSWSYLDNWQFINLPNKIIDNAMDKLKNIIYNTHSIIALQLPKSYDSTNPPRVTARYNKLQY